MRISKLIFLSLFPLSLAGCPSEVQIVDTCGDGVLDPGEACDGEATSAINCEALGYYQQSGELVCKADCTLDLAVCSSRCGDNIIQVGFGEQCEGDDLSAESCVSLGLGTGNLGCNESCRYDTTGCEYSITCGDDRIIHRFEDCEGEDLDGETCESLGWYGGTLSCGEFDCLYELESCANFGKCGDNTVQATYGEDCDGSELGGATCGSLGYYGGSLICDNFCHFDLADCDTFGSCGDGEIQDDEGEICETGNVGLQTCESLGYHGGVLACDATCTALDERDCAAVGRCGDGLVQDTFGEECDGTDLGGATCRGFDYFTGMPSCTAQCGLDSVSCLNATQIVTGGYHSCALLTDGTVKCWGFNYNGQLGDGSTVTSSGPRTVQGLLGVVAITGGGSHNCALLNDTTVKCWGYNEFSQLGDGTTVDAHHPVSVSGLTGALAVSGGSDHTCALLTGGAVKCWGYNSSGRLGDGSTTTRSTPVNVTGLSSGVAAVAAGGSHTCAVLQTGEMKCWGSNTYGKLGDGTTTHSSVPVSVLGLSTVMDAVLGDAHTCARLTDGTAKCWGYNYYGQLGDTTTTQRITPVSVSGLVTVSSMALGGDHSCARLGDGTLRCWGSNYQGELGDGTSTSSSVPVLVPGLTTVSKIAAGEYHTCALTAAGRVFCWGNNEDGQLGDGTLIGRNSPTEVIP